MANHLVSIPEELCQLSALYRLGLKGNQLTHLPETFGGLTGLVELFITGECLHVQPAEVPARRECSTICRVIPLTTQLSEICRQLDTGTAAWSRIVNAGQDALRWLQVHVGV